MNIDFKKLSWEQFQELCCDLLEAEGFLDVRSSGTGSDMGRDIRAKEIRTSLTGHTKEIRWMIQCKHYAKSGNTVGHKEIGDIIGYLDEHNSNGLLIITDTSPTSPTVTKLEKFSDSEKHPYESTFWDKRILENKLRQHRGVLEKYFKVAGKRVKEKKTWRDFNPYKLLDSYREADKEYFFGRDVDIKRLLELVYKHNVIVLFGESGTGKTSLLNAGFIPDLREENFLVVYVRCLYEPLNRIRKEILRVIRDNLDKKIDIDKLGAAYNFPAFIREVQTILDKFRIKLVVVIDQFEELFTLGVSEEQIELANGITELISNPLSNGRLVFLFSLREDFIGNLWNWTHFSKVPEAWENSYRLNKLTEDQAREAIALPAEGVGASYDDRLLDEIVTDLKSMGEGTIYPPDLQINCSTLFDVARDETKSHNSKMVINLEIYSKLGRAEEIIATYFENELWKGFDKTDKSIAKKIVESLIGEGGLRASLTIDEICVEVKADKTQVSNILEKLVKKRAIRPITEEDEIKGYELVHDTLAKRLYEGLHPSIQEEKNIREVFRRDLRAWKKHGYYTTSKDSLAKYWKHRKKVLIDPESVGFFVRNLIKLKTLRPKMKFLDQKIVVETLADILFKENDSWTRYTALDAINNKNWVLDYVPFEETLHSFLNHPYYFTKERAAMWLGKIGDKKATEPLLDELEEYLLDIEEDEGYWGGPRSLCESIIRALGKIGDERAIEPLTPLLKNKYLNDEVLYVLSKLGDKRILPTLLNTIQNEKNWDSYSKRERPLVETYGGRDAIMFLARNFKDERLLNPLLTLLKSDYRIEKIKDMLLQIHYSEKEIRILEKAIEDKDKKFKKNVTEVLDKIKNKQK